MSSVGLLWCLFLYLLDLDLEEEELLDIEEPDKEEVNNIHRRRLMVYRESIGSKMVKMQGELQPGTMNFKQKFFSFKDGFLLLPPFKFYEVMCTSVLQFW